METTRRARSARFAAVLFTLPLLSFAAGMKTAVGAVCAGECTLEAGMTGGGVIRAVNEADGRQVQVTHGFELHCDLSNVPNDLEVNWNGGQSFHLERLGVS